MKTNISNPVFFILLLSFFAEPLFAQTRVEVRSERDSAGLPYATVVNTSRRAYCYTNESGIGALAMSAGDTLRVSSIGYKTATFITPLQGIVGIFLSPAVHDLPQVSVRGCVDMQEVTINNLGNEDGKASFGVSSCVSDHNVKFAVLLKSPQANGRLRKISFWAEKVIEGLKKKPRVPLIILFYGLDTNGLPGELISRTPVTYVVKKHGKQTIDVDSLRIRIPAAGLYLCFAYVPGAKMDFPSTTIGGSSQGQDTIINCSNMKFDGTRAIGGLAFYDIYNDRWFRPAGNTQGADAVRSTIKYEAVIGRCGEE